MSSDFGTLLRNRRAELRLSLRDFALRAEMDAANVSRLERGKSAPPQDDEILERMVRALEWDSSDEAVHFKDVAAVQNGRLPADLAESESLKSALPLLLRTVGNHQLEDGAIEKLIQMIKDA